MADLGWRLVDGVATAWFDAPSLRVGAALAGRVLEVSPGIAVDVRATGVRVRVASEEQAEVVSAAAGQLGLVGSAAALQQVSVVFESPDPSAVQRFWRGVLGYTPTPGGGLVDPLRRDPGIAFRPSDEARPLRHRVHLDVVRPAAMVEQARLGEATGPFGVRHADPDGNEVDVVPGDTLGDSDDTADWQAVFSAMACYRVTSPTQQRDLVGAVAGLADVAGFPLMVDVRPGLVVVDSGKDQADDDAHGLDVSFMDLARDVQAAARELGATTDLTLPRFVQLFLDAADVPAVSAFWLATLGYVHDRRDGVSGLFDPRRLDPVLLFQRIDTSQTERRRQRNRIHFELAVPADLASARVATALAAGGRLLHESPGRWLVADPEGNELVVVAGG